MNPSLVDPIKARFFQMSPALTLPIAGGGGVRQPALRRPAISASAAIVTTARGPYEVLRVRATATQMEIKAAYRSLAKRLHPDASSGSGGGDFAALHEAYATLSDPAARAAYDRSVRQGGRLAAVRPRRWETDQCW